MQPAHQAVAEMTLLLDAAAGDKVKLHIWL